MLETQVITLSGHAISLMLETESRVVIGAPAGEDHALAPA